jgi:hypothetical protein
MSVADSRKMILAKSEAGLNRAGAARRGRGLSLLFIRYVLQYSIMIHIEEPT